MQYSLRTAHRLLQPGRWPDIDAHGGPRLARLRFEESWHLWFLEAMAVAAFARAIIDAPPSATVLDVGANVGAYAVIGAALNRTSTAVEMQPACYDWIRTHAMQLDVPARVRIVTGYFENDTSPIRQNRGLLVPINDCSVLASPSAVAGRWPHGLPTKATRMFVASPPPLKETTRVFAINPGEILPVDGELVVKIDTEGYEIQVLEALRLYWPRFAAVIFEVQPNAWKYSGVSPAQGLATVRALMQQEGLRAAALPHKNPRSAASTAEPAVFDPRAQRWLSADAFATVLKDMLNFPGQGGWFREFALFRAPRDVFVDKYV
jgi:hypothetical protein